MVPDGEGLIENPRRRKVRIPNLVISTHHIKAPRGQERQATLRWDFSHGVESGNEDGNKDEDEDGG